MQERVDVNDKIRTLENKTRAFSQNAEHKPKEK